MSSKHGDNKKARPSKDEEIAALSDVVNKLKHVLEIADKMCSTLLSIKVSSALEAAKSELDAKMSSWGAQPCSEPNGNQG